MDKKPTLKIVERKTTVSREKVREAVAIAREAISAVKQHSSVKKSA